MNWLQKTVLRAAFAVTGYRHYAAATVNRLNGDWSVTVDSADSEIRANLKTLRARSRELSRNNDYVKKFLRMVEINVVGSSGVQLQARVKKNDKELNKTFNQKIEESWLRWSKKRNASASTKLSFKALQRLAIRTVALDGECFVRKISSDNEFGFSLQIIDADWFDENYNEAATDNGNRIVMSVELDRYDKPIAYYMRNPGTDPYRNETVGDYKRIPADEIIHLFLSERPGQTRGVPFAHTAMVRLNQLGGYEEAAVVAARVAASQMGFAIAPPGESIYGDDDEATIMGEVQPGSIQELPAGYDFKQFDPKHPTTSYKDFVKSALRGIASGLCVSYNGLANDLESVNYSSIRHGSLEEREVWKSLQDWFIENFLEDVYEAWLKNAVAFGALPIPVTQYEKALQVRFRPRGWAWVDPLKDMQANQLALDLGVTSLTRIASENGDDIEEILDERKYEQDLIARLGLDLSNGKSATKNQSNESVPGVKPTGE